MAVRYPQRMFFNFVDELRSAGIQASFKEHLTLLEALDKDVIEQSPEHFYYLSRATFVKDEGLLDRFDQVFARVFKGILSDYGQNPVEVPDWPVTPSTGSGSMDVRTCRRKAERCWLPIT